jgi:hypothetical protein
MNQKIWNLYKQTDEYKRLVGIFNPEAEDYMKATESVFQLSVELGDDKDLHSLLQAYDAIEANFWCQGFEFVEESTREDFEAFVDRLEIRRYTNDEEGNIMLLDGDRDVIVKADNYRRKASSVDALSTFLYFHHPYFKPVLLGTRFNIVQENCEKLGIDLPPYPKAHDYKAAIMWYYDLCAVFNEFQKQYEMTDSEFCACLYGLAATLKDDAEKKPLPKPINVWLTGADKEDIDSLEESMDNDSLWTCNENTRRGDIVVLYAISPNSCIHSIWRADSEGTFNPFDYYQNRTRVSEGVKVSRISLKELKEDPEFGKLPMLNNNLQGVNGKRLPSWAYAALLRMIAAKGDDISKLPVLYETKDWKHEHKASEKQVEEEILIPFLHDLGYVDSDWNRQLRLKSGRKEEREIPDFVFFPHGERQFENAPLLIEAKWLMKSEKDRNDAFRQALSYARMLQAPIFGICDEERLIIYQQKNGTFNYNSPAFEAHWAQIAGDPETHNDLMCLIGATVIKSKIRK